MSHLAVCPISSSNATGLSITFALPSTQFDDVFLQDNGFDFSQAPAIADKYQLITSCGSLVALGNLLDQLADLIRARLAGCCAAHHFGQHQAQAHAALGLRVQTVPAGTACP